MGLNDLKVTSVLNGKTYKVDFPCGTIDVVINRDTNGNFVQMNISSSIDILCFSQLDMIGKVITSAIHSGASELDLAHNLSEMICFNKKINKDKDFSTCLKAISHVLEQDFKNYIFAQTHKNDTN